MPFALAIAAAFAGAALGVNSQMTPAPAASSTPHPTKVVARSGRLVTARTSGGGTQSFNCKKPANAKRAVCRKH